MVAPNAHAKNPHFLRRPDCPGCGAGEARTIYTRPMDDPKIVAAIRDLFAPFGEIEPALLEGGPFVVDECAACGLVFQRFVPDELLLKKNYEDWAEPERVRVAHLSLGLPALALYVQELLTVLSHLGLPPHEVDVLDYGMGWGRFCEVARGLGCEAWGFEYSEARRANARAKGLRTVEWDEIPGRRFRFINTEQVVEHLLDPRPTLAHLREGLAPDGLLKISVPDGRHIKRALERDDWALPIHHRHSLNPIFPMQHVNCFTRPALLALGRAVGLAPVDVPVAEQWFVAQGRLALSSVKDLARPLWRRFGPATYVFFRRA